MESKRKGVFVILIWVGQSICGGERVGEEGLENGGGGGDLRMMEVMENWSKIEGRGDSLTLRFCPWKMIRGLSVV